MSLKYPHPFSPSIDHIIPIDRGGHPSDISNLQLAHWKCNRNKANKLVFPVNGVNGDQDTTLVDNSNRNLPLSMDWSTYRGKDRPLPAGGQN
jgi:5-methylcytosine-specific restriction endonuclease McrA